VTLSCHWTGVKGGNRVLPNIGVIVVASDSEDEVKAPEAATTQRRVYALPTEMVERIVEYQQEKGFQSEVEAVRRLLDEALKSRDTPSKIINRFLARLEAHRVVAEAVKDVLVGHPMVEELKFQRDQVTAKITGTPQITISDSGTVSVDSPDWSWIPNSRSAPFGPGRLDDGDPPF